MDKYMVFSISFCKPGNKAQEYVFNNVEKFLHKTIADETDLTAFNNHIHDLVETANQNYPRCTNMGSGMWKDPDDSIHVTVHVGKHEGWLASIKIIEVSNNWKNK